MYLICENSLKQCLTAQNNLFIIAFRPRIVIAHTSADKANLQAGATHPCLLPTRNLRIRAKSK